MAATRCFTSLAMTDLLTWRNPQGSEENWIRGGGRIDHYWTGFLPKVIITEVALVGLTFTAAVESVAYYALELISYLFYPFTDVPVRIFANLLASSSFTFGWASVSLVANLFAINIFTQEMFARLFAQVMIPSMEWLRPEDHVDLAAWVAQLPVVAQDFRDVEVPQSPEKTALIARGAALIRDEVLAGAAEAVLEDFRTVDPGIIPFVLTKAVFIYALGARRHEETPPFFKDETRVAIQEIRDRFPGDVSQGLLNTFNSPADFERGPPEEAREVFAQLRAANCLELKQSLFFERCWQEAARPVLEDTL